MRSQWALLNELSISANAGQGDDSSMRVMTMTTRDDLPLDETDELARSLRELGEVAAPPTLLATVMAGSGLGDAYAPLDTPLGPALVAYNVEGVSALWLGEAADAFEHAHLRRTGRRARPARALPPDLRRTLERRMAGDRRGGRPRFDLRGLSPFEAAVLRKAQEIPYGEVRPYGWVAREIANPRAVRAVGTALGHNPIPLLIPCHRVVLSDGRLGKYALGPESKRRMLTAEGVEPAALERLAVAGERYSGSDTTHIYCFPTCRHARRTTPAHLVTFRSAAEAVAAGYRPCKVCRP
jgi:O-6-methylguanine DNA methyltransferase